MLLRLLALVGFVVLIRAWTPSSAAGLDESDGLGKADRTESGTFRTLTCMGTAGRTPTPGQTLSWSCAILRSTDVAANCRDAQALAHS